MQTIDGAIALYCEVVDGKLRLKQKHAEGWREALPKGSRWFPRCPGDPACKQCEGTGYLRLELPVGHPGFGKLLLCSCAAGAPVPAPELVPGAGAKPPGAAAGKKGPPRRPP